jgi:putative ABC transport system permease protein
METLLKDLRYGIRSLLKRPGFSAVAVITLALGIGANSAIFSAVNAVLLRPLAFPESERVVLIEGVNPLEGITRSSVSVPDVVDWQQQNQSFDQLAAYISGGSLITSKDETERVRASDVSADFFALMRINAIQGRTLQPHDSQPGSEPVAVLSYGLWQKRFGGDPAIVGSKPMIDGKSTTIVGVLPPGFDHPQQSELWAPFHLNAATERRNNRYVGAIARLKPGVTTEAAQADLQAISYRLAQSYGETNLGWSVIVSSLHDNLVGRTRTPLLVLLGAVALVLLIACANVANLLLARANSRQKEIAVRTALGASRLRIIRQLLTESVLLSLLGGAAGFGISVWLTRLLIALSPANTPRFDEIQIDGRVFLFTLGLALLTGLLFGIAPALQTSRLDITKNLKDTGRHGSGNERHNRIGSGLIVTEVALSLMLLVGAGLLMKSYMRLYQVNPGFNPDGVLVLRLGLTPGKYPQGEPRAQIFRQAIEKIKTVPGVESVGGVLTLPLGADTFSLGRGYVREGRPLTAAESGNANYLAATPDYFRAMQIPLINGRTFTDRDNSESPKVVMINETMAGQLWPGESPIGKRITIWPDEDFPREIVGIVGDTRAALDFPAGLQMYVPYAQDPTWGSLRLAIRTSTNDPSSLASAVRNEIGALDKALPVYSVRTMNDVLSTSVADRRASMLLFTAFAIVALLLSVIGIYGVTAYYVTQRTREIGIRMALGAQVRDVLKLVLRQGTLLVLVGVAVGVAGAFALTRLISTLLFGVSPVDTLTFAGASFCLLLVGLIACYVPARRAAKVDPLVALRYE